MAILTGVSTTQRKRPPGAAAAVPSPTPNNPGRTMNGAQPSSGVSGPAGQQAPKAQSSIPTGMAPGRLDATPQAGQAMVSNRAGQIASRGGILFDRAAHQGRAYANQRGLLNSSIAAGASSAAVIDRAAQLAQADVQADLQKQQLALQERDMSFKNSLDQRRLELDEGYRQKALAQQAELDRERQALEQSMQERQIGVTQRGQDIGREVNFAQMELQERLGFGELEIRQDAHELSERLGLGQLGVEQRRVAVDEAIRNQQLSLDRERLASDDAYRARQTQIQEGLAALKAEIDRGTLTLQQQQQQVESDRIDFYKNLDKQRFDADESYRTKALQQQEAIAKRNADIQISRLDLDRDTLSFQERMGASNVMLEVHRNKELAIANYINSMPDGAKVEDAQPYIDTINAETNALADNFAAMWDTATMMNRNKEPTTPKEPGDDDDDKEAEPPPATTPVGTNPFTPGRSRVYNEDTDRNWVSGDTRNTHGTLEYYHDGSWMSKDEYDRQTKEWNN